VLIVCFLQAPWEIEAKKPAKQWPEKGVVEFRDYSTAYRKGLAPVVKNLSVHIKAGEKVCSQTLQCGLLRARREESLHFSEIKRHSSLQRLLLITILYWKSVLFVYLYIYVSRSVLFVYLYIYVSRSVFVYIYIYVSRSVLFVYLYIYVYRSVLLVYLYIYVSRSVFVNIYIYVSSSVSFVDLYIYVSRSVSFIYLYIYVSSVYLYIFF